MGGAILSPERDDLPVEELAPEDLPALQLG
jgi:hypothetical protein